MIWQSVLGLIVFSALAWALSENRGRVRLRWVLTGLLIQLAVGLILLKLPLFRDLFLLLNRLVLSLEEATRAGTAFVFGYLGGGELPFEERFPGASFVLAFQALPLVLLMSALSALLFYWRVLPLVVRGFAWALQKSMRIGGTEGVAVSANVFVGMIEAPLVWLMGVPWTEAPTAGALMGTKTILNEFIAYLDLSRLAPGTLAPRSLLIMTYALCGFANPGSLGIMIGGLGTMAPGRREEIVALGLRSIVAGTLATSMTGCVVGILG